MCPKISDRGLLSPHNAASAAASAAAEFLLQEKTRGPFGRRHPRETLSCAYTGACTEVSESHVPTAALGLPEIYLRILSSARQHVKSHERRTP